jgi:hypothetical protein
MFMNLDYCNNIRYKSKVSALFADKIVNIGEY